MPGKFNPKPITLEGPRLKLIPLDTKHAKDLYYTLGHPNIFRYMPIKPPHHH